MKRKVVRKCRLQRAPGWWDWGNDVLDEQRLGAAYGIELLLKDSATGSPVTEIGYKRHGRTRRGGYGNMFTNWGGTTKLL